MAVDKARLFDDIVRALSLVIDWHEGEQLLHAWRVGWLAQAVGRELGEPDPSLYLYAGLLHDIGAVEREEHIVEAAVRAFPHDDDRAHPAASARLLAPLGVLAPAVALVADHHERLDGGGFPAGKAGDAIPRGALLVALADAVDVACRVAGPAGRERAVPELLRREAGRGWPAPLSEAALALLARQPGLLEDLHDARALRTAVARAGDARRWVEGVEPLDLLGQLLWLFPRVVEAKHPSTLGHAVRVTDRAHRIARVLGDQGPSTWEVVFAGLLHDVGLAALPRSLVAREGHPGAGSGPALQRHARETHAILSTIRDLAHLAAPAAAHHERYDGKGYPFGLAGEEIPLLGRILAVADAYDGLTAGRQGAALDHRAALAAIQAGAGTAFDPHVAEAAAEALAGGPPAAGEEEGPSGLLRLLQGDAPDVRGAVDRAHRQARPARLAQATWASAPAWRVVIFDGEGAVRQGHGALRAVAGPRQVSLWDLVDREAVRSLAERLGQTEEAVLATPLVSAQGHAVEAMVRRRGEGFELLYRDAPSQARTMERTALFYRNFLASSEAAFFVDAEGRVVDASDTFLDLYGFERAGLVGRAPPIFSEAGGRSGLAQLLAQAHGQLGRGWVGEVATCRGDGSPIPALVTVTVVNDAAGAHVGYAFRLVDISARLELERDLAAKNASLEAVGRLKSELLAIASHDLKAPVAAMMSHARLLRGSLATATPEAATRTLDLLVRLGQGGLDLIERMLCLEQLEAGTFRLQVVPLRLDELLGGCVAGLAPVALERGVELALELPGPVRLSTGDPTRLVQVFNNLVSNAMRHAPPGTRVEVSCEDRGDRLVCAVSDRGPGIPPGDEERIFERYTQGADGGRGGGVGLGLYVTRTVVTAHGGRVRVEARPGGGSRFVVELPAGSPALPPGPPAAVVLGAGLAAGLFPVLQAAGLRPLEARDWTEVARLGAAAAPDLVLAGAEEPGLAARARAAAPGCTPVAVRREAGAPVADRAADLAVLDPPVLDVEVAALAREARRRRAPAAAPPPRALAAALSPGGLA